MITNLNILKSEVFCLRTSLGLELRLDTCNDGEEVPNGDDNAVHVEVDMISVRPSKISRAQPLHTFVHPTHAPIASASILALLRVSTLEFSVPM